VGLRTIELKIARGENLPVLRQAVSAAFKVADDPSSKARDIEKLIGQDPGLTAKILHVVNSPLYGVNQIGSPGRAIAVLGTNRVRSLVVSVAFQNLVNYHQDCNRFDMLEYWRHSMAVATAARLIGNIKSPARSEAHGNAP
jgi:HD-like signal output (HDOD) protein